MVYADSAPTAGALSLKVLSVLDPADAPHSLQLRQDCTRRTVAAVMDLSDLRLH